MLVCASTPTIWQNKFSGWKLMRTGKLEIQKEVKINQMSQIFLTSPEDFTVPSSDERWEEKGENDEKENVSYTFQVKMFLLKQRKKNGHYS